MKNQNFVTDQTRRFSRPHSANRRRGVSTTVFAATIAVLLVIAAVGYALYLTKTSPTATSISYVTTTLPGSTSVVTVTVPGPGTTVTAPGSETTVTVPIQELTSGAFYNGRVITFNYTAKFFCTPPLSQFFSNQTQANQLTSGCEVGAANMSAFPSNAAPLYVLVPAFAGLSIFGVHSLGATSLGFPTFVYNGTNTTIVTQCGAALTQTECPDHMSLIYSPAFTAVEQHLGIKNGVFGLPEGVLPTPAHEHLVTFTDNQSIPWYLVIVLVFNPNIFPNPITGQCSVMVPSNQSNPVANCLNNYSALESALTTHDSAVTNANTGNPIWQTLGDPTLQVLVPGISSVSQLSSASNSNMLLYFSDPPVYPYPV
jgi:hypothetical protein